MKLQTHTWHEPVGSPEAVEARGRGGVGCALAAAPCQGHRGGRRAGCSHRGASERARARGRPGCRRSGSRAVGTVSVAPPALNRGAPLNVDPASPCCPPRPLRALLSPSGPGFGATRWSWLNAEPVTRPFKGPVAPVVLRQVPCGTGFLPASPPLLRVCVFCVCHTHCHPLEPGTL